MVKKTVSFCVDEEIWELAKVKLDQPRGEFLEDQLKYAIELADDKESVILKKIVEKHEELSVLESQLCSLREARLSKKLKMNLVFLIMQ